MDAWGERGVRIPADDAARLLLFEDVEDARECDWTWWSDRMDETEEEVDFLPRRPADERRYEERGVTGIGERDFRLLGVVARALEDGGYR